MNIAYLAKSDQTPQSENACIVKMEDIPWTELTFDHVHILKDYVEWRNGDQPSMILP